MKKSAVLIAIPVLVFLLCSCKKEKKTDPEPEAPAPTIDNYTSFSDFNERNGVQKQTFSFDAGTGGNFVSAQGTTINIPANAFAPASANITFEFKEIYKKSDMVLSDWTTTQFDGAALISGGEIFLKALKNGVQVNLESGKTINVFSPVKAGKKDTMRAFVGMTDTSGMGRNVWSPFAVNVASVVPGPTVTVPGSELYTLNVASLLTGGWFNYDHSFPGYPQTKLIVNPTLSNAFPKIYLIFKNLNSTVSLYRNYITGITQYDFAPIGLECTIVTMLIKEGKLFASFTPITISANQTVNVNLTEMSANDFKTALKAFD